MTYPTPITGDFDPTDPCRGHAAAILMSSARSRPPHASKGDQAMTEIDLIVSQIGAARRYTEGVLGDIDESDWFRMPAGGVTHVAWQVGHLAYAEYRTALERIRGVAAGDAELIPEAVQRLFGRESVPPPRAAAAPGPPPSSAPSSTASPGGRSPSCRASPTRTSTGRSRPPIPRPATGVRCSCGASGTRCSTPARSAC